MKKGVENLKSQGCSASPQEDKYKKAKKEAKEKLDKARKECKELFGDMYNKHF